MNQTAYPLFSIVIPTKNEENDITDTLNLILNIDYPNKEIIVVDDSTDNTPNIVKEYKDVRLIHREKNSNGCCGARNLGMQESNGEIVVIMNADVRPSKDFLLRIYEHYQNGADYVVVRSMAMNDNNLWGMLVSAKENAHIDNLLDDEWSEGFSCRKKAASSVGYIPGNFPLSFCRDWMFGRNLNKSGFKKIVDSSITINHVVPEKISDFWRERIWRGSFSAPSYFYFSNKNKTIVFLREIAKSFKNIIIILLIFPMLFESIKLSRFARVQKNIILKLFIATNIESIALIIGNYKGLYKLITSRNA